MILSEKKIYVTIAEIERTIVSTETITTTGLNQSMKFLLWKLETERKSVCSVFPEQTVCLGNSNGGSRGFPIAKCRRNDQVFFFVFSL